MTWQEYCNQASQLVSQGRYKEAEAIILEAFKEAREAKDLQRVYTSLDLLGWLAFVQHKFMDAEKIYQHVVNVKSQLFGRTHVEIAKTLKNLIASSYQLKQYDRVVHYASEAARIYATNLGAHHPECQQIAKNLFELLKWMGRTGEAQAVYQQYLAPPAQQPPPPQPVPQQQHYQQPAASQPSQQTPPQQNRSAAATANPEQQGNLSSSNPYARHPVGSQSGQYAAQQSQSGQYGSGQQPAQSQYPNQNSQQNQQPPADRQPQTVQQSSSGSYQSPGQYAQQQPAQTPQNQAQPTGYNSYNNQSAQATTGQHAQPNSQYSHLPMKAAPQEAQPAQQEPPKPAQASPQKRKDYTKFAKNICDVCQYEYEGSECLRCTSGEIAVFDPNSRLNW